VESRQPKIAAWAHAQELPATRLQSPLQHPHSGAKGRYARLSSDTRCPWVLETEHDRSMASLCRQTAACICCHQPSYKRVDEFLLEGSCRFLVGKNLRFRLGDTAGTR